MKWKIWALLIDSALAYIVAGFTLALLWQNHEHAVILGGLSLTLIGIGISSSRNAVRLVRVEEDEA